jgi:4-hydroxybenzoate polyprenyltransferase
VLRALAGTTVLEVGNPTVWLILTTFLFALFLAFGKRRHELLHLEESASHRAVLGHYTVDLVEQMTNIVATLLLASYVLYTALGTTPWMMFTIPFVLYGVFRYLYLIKRRGQGDEPELILRDAPTLVNAGAWIGAVGLVLLGVPQAVFAWLQTL